MSKLIIKKISDFFCNFVRKTKAFCKSMSTLITPDKIAAGAALLSVAAAVATIWSSSFSKDQALSARLSAKAALDTLQRSDENLVILTDVDRDAPVTLSGTILGNYLAFSIKFSAHAVIINTGGSPAIVMDSIVETDSTASQIESRVDIFDASDRAPLSKLSVIQPNDPLRLILHGSLSSSSRRSPRVTKDLLGLFTQTEVQSGHLDRQFSSFAALSGEIHKRYGEGVAHEFDSFLYGPAYKPGSISSTPWSKKGEVGFSRIILKLSTASHRLYRSAPGLLVVGPDPSYSIQ
ncbi:hypothetical protein HW509_13345 [Asaia spathodeae]|uniref:hypothetical protein n=1 Tax=Asaia spathodeae TaxID=657016 RepID=UPI002FC2FD7F